MDPISKGEGGIMDNGVRFCTGCGFKMDKDCSFCPACGTRISGEKQGPVSSTTPSIQTDQNYGMNYTNNNSMYNQRGNSSQYQPYYNNYNPPQYIPPAKKTNTPLIVVLIIVGVLILAAGGYFGLKLLQGNAGANTGSSNTKNSVTVQDVSGVWEGTVIFNDAKNLNKSADTEQIIKVLNKPLKTIMEIVPDSKNSGRITIYIAEDVGEEPNSYGLPLTYQLNNGELKAQIQESGNIIAVDFKLGSKNGISQLKGTLTISGIEPDSSIGTIKGNVDITWASKITIKEGSTPKENVPEANNADENSKSTDNNSGNNNSGSNTQGTQIPQYIKDPKAYLPKPSMRYTFQAWYQDGDSEKFDVVAGVIPGFSIVTSVDIYEQSEAFTQHFVDGPDGVYVFSDEEFNENSALWIPFNAKVGDSWDVDGVPVKIIKLGASCDLGYKKLDNCIVMEIDYSEAGVIYTSYIAPGIGTVLMTDKESGNLRMKLLDAVPISGQEASGIVKQYSPKAMSALSN